MECAVGFFYLRGVDARYHDYRKKGSSGCKRSKDFNARFHQRWMRREKYESERTRMVIRDGLLASTNLSERLVQLQHISFEEVDMKNRWMVWVSFTKNCDGTDVVVNEIVNLARGIVFSFRLATFLLASFLLTTLSRVRRSFAKGGGTPSRQLHLLWVGQETMVWFPRM